MKKILTPLMLASIVWLFLAGTAGAQKLPEGMTMLPSSQQFFESSSAITTEAPAATQQVSAATVNNSYGQHIIDRYKAMGRPLPAPESEILKLKPAKAPANAPLKAGEKPVEFIGFLNYNDLNGRMLLEYGLYKFSTASGLKRETYADVNYVINFGGAYIGNRFTGYGGVKVGGGSSSPHICTWDLDTWRPIEEVRYTEDDALYMVGGVCTDPVTQTVYGYAQDYHSGGTSLCKVDYANRTSKVVAYTDSTIIAFAIDANGVGYAMTDNNYLVKVDLATGKVTPVGHSGFDGTDVLQSMAFDYETGKLYYAISQVDWDTEEVLGTLQEIDTTTGKATLVGYFPENEEYTCLYVLHTPNNGAPADITDLNVIFENGSLSGKTTFTIPTTTEDGGTLSGNVNYTIYLQDDEANPITGTAAAGSVVTQTLTATQTGWYKVVVVLDNAAGKGRRIAKEVWVGNDSPKATNATFKYDEATHQATVEWTLGGVNGGYSNPEGITYEIVRNPGAVKVGTNVTGTSFTETFEPGYHNSYYYVITPYLNESAGEKVATNMIQMGKAYEPPFTEKMDSVGVINRYLIIDANNDKATWAYYQLYNGLESFYYGFSKENKADDWILTPPLKLKKGCEYEFSFGEAVISTEYTEKFAVVFGQGTDPSNYTVLADDLTTKVTLSKAIQQGFDPKSTKVIVEEDGEYRFGFHITSDPLQGALFLADIAVSEGELMAGPDSVTNLSATAAAEGELSATFTFNAPTVDCRGEKLDELTQIVLYREDGEVACTLDNPVPGQACTITDADALNGLCTYTIAAFNKEGKGRPATISLYIGLDAPVAPIVRLIDNCDGTANLSWSVPVVGENGGYVDVDGLEYIIYGYDTETGLQMEAEGVTSKSYAVTGIPTTGEQSRVYYAVQAVSDFGKSEIAASNYIISGTPYALNYFEGFDIEGTNGLWIYDTSDSKQAGAGVVDGTSHDLTGTSAVLLSKASDQWASLTSGKISLADAQNPHLVFFYYNLTGTNQQLDVIIHSNGFATSDTVFTIDFNQSMGTVGFKKVDIDLNNYKDQAYIDIEFRGTLNGTANESGYVIFDDINVVDLQPNNMAVSAIAPEWVRLYNKLPITVMLHNIGTEKASDYSTGVIINGNEYMASGLDAIESFEWLEYAYNYQTSVSDSIHTKLWAVVELDGDADQGNNCSDTLNVTIVMPNLPTPQNLVAVEADGKHHLTWDAPDTDSSVKSYNIYRNGELVATVDASELSCDVPAVDGTSIYVVTAVYESGQSGPSNTAVIDRSGIEELNSNSNKPVAGIDYFTVDGRQNSGLQPGVNIVRIHYTDGSTVTRKIMVK